MQVIPLTWAVKLGPVWMQQGLESSVASTAIELQTNMFTQSGQAFSTLNFSISYAMVQAAAAWPL